MQYYIYFDKIRSDHIPATFSWLFYFHSILSIIASIQSIIQFKMSCFVQHISVTLFQLHLTTLYSKILLALGRTRSCYLRTTQINQTTAFVLLLSRNGKVCSSKTGKISQSKFQNFSLNRASEMLAQVTSLATHFGTTVQKVGKVQESVELLGQVNLKQPVGFEKGVFDNLME